MPAPVHETKRRRPSGRLVPEEADERLAEARSRTLALVADVREDDLNRAHDPLMSPFVWDLGHVAAFEDLWLAQRTGGMAPLRPDSPRSTTRVSPRGRAAASSPTCGATKRWSSSLRRARSLEVLDRSGRIGPVWELVVQHEHQHNETMLQTLQLAEAGVYSPPRPRQPAKDAQGTTRVEAGPFPLGDAGDEFAYDNERPQHVVHVPAFEINRTPVSNAAYLAFVEDGGYHRRELWSAAGWEWREAEGIERPLYWTADGRARSFDRLEPLDPDRPVMHVNRRAPEIVRASQAAELVELGSGSTSKTRALLHAMAGTGTLRRYVPQECHHGSRRDRADDNARSKKTPYDAARVTRYLLRTRQLTLGIAPLLRTTDRRDWSRHRVRPRLERLVDVSNPWPRNIALY